jgi:hypothetical protein
MTVYVLDSEKPSHWQSLNQIYPSVRAALRLASRDLAWIDVDHASLTCSVQDAVYVLNAEAPLDLLLKNCAPEVPVYLPIYGDMTIEHEKWRRWDKALRGKNIHFLAASPRSAEQIKSLVSDPSVTVLPYPVADCFFDAQRQSVAAHSLVYAGRITPQKNVLELMHAFLTTKQWGDVGQLHIAGQFHDRGYHFHSRLVDQAEFERTFHRLVQDSGGSILYHGALSQDELTKLFGQCGHVVSLSTYHDEDYGMSVAQAMAMGCVPILSDWGGHGFFLGCQGATAVTVSLDEFAIPHPRSKSIMKALATTSADAAGTADIRAWARTQTSVTAVATRLRSILANTPAKPYAGQSDNFHQFCASYDRGRAIPFHHKDAGFRELYLRIYSSYLGVSSVEDR